MAFQWARVNGGSPSPWCSILPGPEREFRVWLGVTSFSHRFTRVEIDTAGERILASATAPINCGAVP